MFDNIEKYRNIIKMASSTMDTGYEEEGYSTTTSNGNNVVVYTVIDTHDEYKKIVTIKLDDKEYHMDYDDVYHSVKNGNVKLSENDLIDNVCIVDNDSYYILRDELVKYITKCFNINEKLTLDIVHNFSGTSTDMKIQAFNIMIRLVEKDQEVVVKDNILQDRINAMDTYIQSLG